MYLTLGDRPGAEESGDATEDATEDADAPAPTATLAPPRSRSRVPGVVVTLGVVSMLTDISSEAVAAILPLYLTAVVGMGAIGYGVIDGLHQGVSALVRVAGGWAADTSDHPKWIAVVGYGLSAFARLGLMFAAGAGAIAAVVTADRIGKGVRTAPRDVMIATAASTEDLGRAFGVHRALDTVGAAVGPLMAFVVLWLVPDGYLTVMGLSLGFAVVGVALLGLLVPDVRPRMTSATPEPMRFADLRDPRLVRLLAVAAGLGVLTVGDGFIYLALLDRAEFAAAWFPLLVVGTNVVFLGLAVPLGRLADRIGRARMLGLGHLALVAAYASAASPGKGWIGTVAALVFLGCFYAATDGVLAAVASRAVPAASRASGIAAAQTATALARLMASMGFGLLWYLLGPQTALLVVGAALLAVVPLALAQLRRLEGALL